MYTVGGDPEFFLLKDSIPTSPHNMVPGTKEKPHKLAHGAVQVDGMAVEFNIDPAKTDEEFEHNIEATIGEIRKLIPKEYKFHFGPTVTFPAKLMDIVPECNKELGCSPDWNAFTGLQNTNPIEQLKLDPFTRSAGGHISIGWAEGLDKKDPSHVWDCETFVKAVDPFYRNCRGAFDQDNRRAKLYGKPGAYRPTTFGVEYRTPSNAWVGYPMLYRYMFKLMTSTMDTLVRGDNVFTPPYLPPGFSYKKRND